MEKLKFYDLKAKKPFTTDKYKVVVKNKRRFAVAKAPHGKYECWRVLGKSR